MERKEHFYYIKNRDLVGRGAGFDHQIFRDGRWVEDDGWLINDRLVGYDPDEPPGSPYGFGSLGIMDEMEEITKDEAMEIIRRQTEDAGKGR